MIRTAPVLMALALATAASAQTVVLTTTLSGANEVPPNTSPATGSATMTIDVSTRNYSLAINFTGLTAGMTIAHIHRGAVGVNGPILVWLDGMQPAGSPGVTPFIPAGSTSFSGTLNGTFPAADLNNLLAGSTYINIHTSAFPGGEIRGNLIPTPGTLAMLGVGGLLAARRRR